MPKMRRVEDLNLCGLSPTRFRGVRHKPLGQPSKHSFQLNNSLVYPGGIEPLTFGSANQCSIQLSYGYIVAIISKFRLFSQILPSRYCFLFFSLKAILKSPIWSVYLQSLETRLLKVIF